MALLGIITVDKVGWAGNAESLLGIIVSAGWAGETLTVLEKGSVTRAVLANPSVVVPDLVISAYKAFRAIVMGEVIGAVALPCCFAIDKVRWTRQALP